VFEAQVLSFPCYAFLSQSIPAGYPPQSRLDPRFQKIRQQDVG
jgi:hypothetical protein